MVLATFAETKVARLPGPNPAYLHLVQSFDFVLQLNKIPYTVSPEDAQVVWPS